MHRSPGIHLFPQNPTRGAQPSQLPQQPATTIPAAGRGALRAWGRVCDNLWGGGSDSTVSSVIYPPEN